MTQIIPATCVLLDRYGLLIRGPAKAGKSDLALRLIDSYGAQLVADGQVVLTRVGPFVHASPPDDLAGLLNVHGLGKIKLDDRPDSPVQCVIDLVSDHKAIEPMPKQRHTSLLGVDLPLYTLAPFENSVGAKIRQIILSLDHPTRIISP